MNRNIFFGLAIFLSSCASSESIMRKRVATLEKALEEQKQESAKLKAELGTSIRTSSLASHGPAEHYEPLGFVSFPPAHIGYLTGAPPGFGESGNEARSVVFSNTGDARRYYLRVWIDGTEVQFVGEMQNGPIIPYQGLIETDLGARPASLLPPGGESKHNLPVGRHEIRVARYSGPATPILQYVDTCLWRDVDPNSNTSIRGGFKFNGYSCEKLPIPN